MTIVKNLMEKPSFFIMDFEGSFEVLLCRLYFWSIYFWQWNYGPFNFFWNFHGNAFCFFIFSKWKKYYNLTFDDTFKIYCCALCQSKFKHHKWALFTERWMWHYVFFDFRFLVYVYFNEAFLKNFMKKLSFFNTNSKIHFKM